MKRSLLVTALLLLVGSALCAAVTEVGPIGLTVADVDREVAFYTQVLPFEKISETRAEGTDADRHYALTGVHTRTVTLQLGSERITLTEFVAPRGHAIPADSRSFDHWFQHIAIVVSDTDRSLTYYRDALGLKVAGGAENYGVEQEHLNQVLGARLRITALRAARGPGLELLEYITPPGGRPLASGAQPNDQLAWRVALKTENPAQTATAAITAAGRLVSPDLLRDPDGHLLELTP